MEITYKIIIAEVPAATLVRAESYHVLTRRQGAGTVQAVCLGERGQVSGLRHKQELDFCHSLCSHNPWTHTCACVCARKHTHTL